MNDSFNSPEFIDRFLAGTLSKEEELAMKSEIKSSPELKLMVEEQLKLRAAAYHIGRHEWLGNKDSELDLLIARTRRKKIQTAIPIAIAGMAAIIALLFFVNRSDVVPQTEDLYAAYYERPPALEMRGSAVEQKLMLAYLEFNQSHFSEALLMLDSLHAQLPTHRQNEANFFRAICHIELNQVDQAVELLAKIQSGDYANDALWFQAMALLKGEQKALAVNVLSQLSREDNPYKARALEILENLE